MTTIFKLDACAGARPDAVGLASNPLTDGLWVLYSDRSLSYFADSAVASWTLPGAVCDLRAAHTLPGNILTRVVSYSSWSVQLWTRLLHGDLRLEAQTEPVATHGCELTALAVSPWLVACGHANGEVKLLAALHGLSELGPMPSKHGAEVSALSFGHWKPASLRPVLLASVSQDRSAFIFSIDLQQGSSGIESSRASLLLHLQHHSSPVQHVALLTDLSTMPSGSEVFRVVVCTSDQLIWREAECTESQTSVHKCARQQAARGSRWVGICTDAARGFFYAACSSRRVLQLDQAGRRTHEVCIGASNVEIVGPIQLSNDGRFLATALKGAAGILLFSAENSLQPLARLAAGHAEPPKGVTFLPGDRIIACWTDGTLLSWKAPEKQIARGLATTENQPEEAARRGVSPRDTCIVSARSLKLRPASGSPPRRRSGSGSSSVVLRSSSSALAPRKRAPLSARSLVTTSASLTAGSQPMKAARPSMGDAERQRIKESIKQQIQGSARQDFKKDGRAPAPNQAVAAPRVDGLRELRRLLASSPSPPRWAETSILDDPPAEHAQQETEPLGKWARGSLVGAQVRSASDLHRVGPREELLEHEEVQVRCASEGAQKRCQGSLKRQLFCTCGKCATGRPLQPLPPKPVFAPPGQAPPGLCPDAEISAISTSSAAPTVASVVEHPASASSRPSKLHNLQLCSLPTPCRGRPDQAVLKSPRSELEDLVDTVVTLKTRLSSIQPDRLPPQEASLLLEPLQKFEFLLRSQMKSK